MKKLLHFIRPRSCINYLRINSEAEIVCDVCGRAFGFTYDLDPIRAFIYHRYLKFKPEIVRFVHHAETPPTLEDWVSARHKIMDRVLEAYTVSASSSESAEHKTTQEETS